jgi:Transposase IS66 family
LTRSALRMILEGIDLKSLRQEEQILEVRQRESVPLMNQMKELLQSWQIVTPPKTPLGIAINYGLARWDKLCRFTEALRKAL